LLDFYGSNVSTGLGRSIRVVWLISDNRRNAILANGEIIGKTKSAEPAQEDCGGYGDDPAAAARMLAVPCRIAAKG